jgi:hypothetical protein
MTVPGRFNLLTTLEDGQTWTPEATLLAFLRSIQTLFQKPNSPYPLPSPFFSASTPLRRLLSRPRTSYSLHHPPRRPRPHESNLSPCCPSKCTYHLLTPKLSSRSKSTSPSPLLETVGTRDASTRNRRVPCLNDACCGGRDNSDE